MAYKLPIKVYSPDHIRFCIEELESYAGALDKDARGSTNAGSWGLSSESSALVEMLPKAKKDEAEAMRALVEWLNGYLSASRVIGITLAAPGSHKLKEELVTWLRENVAKDILVEFSVNPDIAGGMVMRSTNRIYDMSFRSLLLNKPERFTRILENV